MGKNVTIVDSSTKVGGILNSKPWKGYDLDIGCHVFDNDQDKMTELVLDILDNEVSPSLIKYASFLNNQKTDGISIPDLSSLGEETSRKILWETIKASSENNTQAISLFDKHSHVHGKTGASIIEKLLAKTHIISAKEVDALAFDLTTYSRIKFLDDKMGRVLKGSEALDKKVAVSSQNNPMEFYQNTAQNYSHRNFYPNRNGTRLFCEKAEEKLTKLGVSLLLGHKVEKVTPHSDSVEVKIDSQETIQADYVLWASPQELLGDLFGIENQLKELVFPVPLVLHYFALDKKYVSDYSYIHNFDSHFYTFRASIPNNYGKNNAPEGKTYICCEIPCQKGSAIWNQPENYKQTIWNELLEMKLVTSDAVYEDNLVLKTPVSYKLPKVGYQVELQRVLSEISRERILGADEWKLTKNSILTSIFDTIQKA